MPDTLLSAHDDHFVGYGILFILLFCIVFFILQPLLLFVVYKSSKRFSFKFLMKHLIAAIFQITIVAFISLGFYEISAPSLQKFTGLNFAMIEMEETFFFGPHCDVSFLGDFFEIYLPKPLRDEI